MNVCSIWCAAQHAYFMLDLDVSPEMIENARGKYLHSNLNWQIIDSRDFNVEHDFDTVFSNSALQWIQHQNVIACSYRALKIGRRLGCECRKNRQHCVR